MTCDAQTSAQRMRRYRQRQVQGVVVARAEVPRSIADLLVQAGFLEDTQLENGKAIGAALVRAVALWGDRFAAELVALPSDQGRRDA